MIPARLDPTGEAQHQMETAAIAVAGTAVEAEGARIEGLFDAAAAELSERGLLAQAAGAEEVADALYDVFFNAVAKVGAV